MPQDHFALAVGIDAYPQLGNLAGAANDAQAFLDWVRDPTGGDVPEQNVAHWLVGPRPHPFPQQVDDLLFAWWNGAATAHRDKVGQRLYLYFAGHGVAKGQDSALLLLPGARPNSPVHVSCSAYLQWFRENGYFEEILLFTDCCRQQVTRLNEYAPVWGVTEGAPGDREWVRGFAAAVDVATREEKGPDGVARGRYTRDLLEGLRKAALPDGRVTAFSLDQYLQQRSWPPLVYQPADLTLCRLAPPGALKLKIVSDGVARRVHLRDADGASVVDDPTPVEVDLAPSLYELAVDGGPFTGFRLHASDAPERVIHV